jgi:cysteine synthase A
MQTASGTHRVGLKLEMYNPTGSIKYRTAKYLIADLVRRGRLQPGMHVVESSSGNLAVALAWLARKYDFRFTAVTDPNTDRTVINRIEELGVDKIEVSNPDDAGGYLMSRLDLVRQLVNDNPSVVWTNQYERLANPAAHFCFTGPELHRQCREVDAVFVAVSTGGTLAGVGRYFRRMAPGVYVIAVDVAGSRALGGAAGKRVLTGIGSSRPSSLARRRDYDDVVLVAEVDAVAACHYLYSEIGLGLGASSGAVLAACARYLSAHPEIRRPVCLCPDGRANYLQTVYDHDWLARHSEHLGGSPLHQNRLPFRLRSVADRQSLRRAFASDRESSALSFRPGCGPCLLGDRPSSVC